MNSSSPSNNLPIIATHADSATNNVSTNTVPEAFSSPPNTNQISQNTVTPQIESAKGGSYLQNILLWSNDVGTTYGFDEKGKAIGQWMKPYLDFIGKGIQEQSTKLGITGFVSSGTEKVKNAVASVGKATGLNNVFGYIGKKTGLNFVANDILALGKASPLELAGRSIALIGWGLFGAGFAVTHIVGAYAGIMIFNLLQPMTIPVAIIAGAIDGALHGPLFSELIAHKLGLDPDKTNLATACALGITGALLGAFQGSIFGIATAEIFIVGLSAKAVIIPGMFLTNILSSSVIAFGEGLAEGGKDEKIDDMFYNQTIKKAIANTFLFIDQKTNELGKPIYDAFNRYKRLSTEET